MLRDIANWLFGTRAEAADTPALPSPPARPQQTPAGKKSFKNVSVQELHELEARCMARCNTALAEEERCERKLNRILEEAADSGKSSRDKDRAALNAALLADQIDHHRNAFHVAMRAAICYQRARLLKEEAEPGGLFADPEALRENLLEVQDALERTEGVLRDLGRQQSSASSESILNLHQRAAEFREQIDDLQSARSEMTRVRQPLEIERNGRTPLPN